MKKKKNRNKKPMAICAFCGKNYEKINFEICRPCFDIKFEIQQKEVKAREELRLEKLHDEYNDELALFLQSNRSHNYHLSADHSYLLEIIFLLKKDILK
jgi:hypothetical protein